MDKNFWSGRPRRAAAPAGSSTTTDTDCFAAFVQQRHLPVGYVADLNAYYAAIHPLLPATASASAAWLNAFGSGAAGKASLLTAHFYEAGPATAPTITIQTLIGSTTHEVTA